MKKLFLFSVALLTSLMVGATIHTLEPGENKIETAIASAQAGDVIELTGDANHVYTEWNHIVIDKTITIRAAEGATPKVKIHYVDINASFEANGIQFISHNTAYYWFQTTTGGTFDITFKGCTFTDCVGNYIYYLPETQSISSLTIDNCIMNTAAEGNNDRFLYTCGVIDKFTMINSTIMNHPGGYPCYVRNVAISLLVDHCTFYNNGNRPLLLGDIQCPVNACVKNCVVSNPATVENYCIATYAGTVDNCVYYNTASAPRSASPVVVNGCINANPLFADPANGDFNFSVFSPLCFAATDGTHIGDPRWTMVSEEGVDLPATLDKYNVGATSADMTYYGESGEYFDFGPNDSSNDTLRWAKWLVNIKKCAYSVSAELTSENSYKLVFDMIDPSTGAVVLTSDTAKSSPSFKTIDFSRLEEKAYILRLKNREGWSKVKVKSLTFTYAGGAVVDIPDTLPVADAILSSGASINEGGYITYHDAGTDNARWNINATKAGSMSVTMDVAATNGHTYMVALYSMEGDSITAVKEHGWTDDSGTMSLEGTMTIPQAGNYYVVVKNTVSGSTAVYKDVTFTYAGGGVVTIPGTLSPVDAMLSERAFIENDTIIFAPRNSEGYTPDGWAKWNVRLENDAICAFTANCHRFSGNSMNIKISVINTENDTIYQKEENVENSGNSEVALGNILLTAGDYVIQMQNTVQHSKGRLMSVVVGGSPVLVITDDSDIDFTAYAGQTVNVQLNRTFKANMYNPICLPFAVSYELFQQIFKSPKSFVLNKATLENQKLFVELAENYGIYQGTPVMVKPTEDVVNPIFENVQINATTPSSTTKGVLRLQGSFASHTIDNPQNALLVGANNTLFFPNDETPYIKSMRAYFILQDIQLSQMPKFACFREPGNAPTWMPIVGAETEKPNGKFIRDGRFVIVREGKEYNAQGIEL
ncbi:MAG: DUF5123 domain-containing protein [Paludibacteraceae bacterium]|nr:DUF5123 domain-containing protein [Paludibacteraceae bacterium]